MKKIIFTILITFTFTICSCNDQISWFNKRFKNSANYYLVGDANTKKELRKLFEQKEQSEGKYETTFTIMQQIIKLLLKENEKAKLNLFLTTYAENNYADPFNAYYLFIVARDYQEDEAFPLATHYYDRVIKNFSDLLIDGESIHNICLKNLIKVVEEPEKRINYYKELIARFSEKNRLYPDLELIDKGPTYYYMAKTYEELGEWDLAIQSYRNFLQYPDCQIQGFPRAHEEIANMIAFYDYRNKNWIMDDLNELVKYIQWAIWGKNPTNLNKYRAKVNFFAIAWEENSQEASINGLDEFYSDLGIFMDSKLRCLDHLDPDSNLQEAYLESRGWSHRIPTWYLYFRKISFPADPEINGKWEWAGIYLGEKPFSGAVEE